jgi:hypothetical protein
VITDDIVAKLRGIAIHDEDQHDEEKCGDTKVPEQRLEEEDAIEENDSKEQQAISRGMSGKAPKWATYKRNGQSSAAYQDSERTCAHTQPARSHSSKATPSSHADDARSVSRSPSNNSEPSDFPMSEKDELVSSTPPKPIGVISEPKPSPARVRGSNNLAVKVKAEKTGKMSHRPVSTYGLSRTAQTWLTAGGALRSNLRTNLDWDPPPDLWSSLPPPTLKSKTNR